MCMGQDLNPKGEGMILYRRYDPIPGDDENVETWSVECWPDDVKSTRPTPLGIAWVRIWRELHAEEVREGSLREILWHVLVADDLRRRGVGMRLIEACLVRWPNIHITEGISTAGLALRDSVDRRWPRIPVEVFSDAAKAQMRAAGIDLAEAAAEFRAQKRSLRQEIVRNYEAAED